MAATTIEMIAKIQGDASQINDLFAQLKQQLADLQGGGKINPVDAKAINESLLSVKESLKQVDSEMGKIGGEKAKTGFAKIKEEAKKTFDSLPGFAKGAAESMAGILGGNLISGAFSKLTGGIESFFEAGFKKVEAVENLKVAFKGLGLEGADLDAQMSSSGKNISRISKDYAISAGDVRELTREVAFLGGAAGPQNDKIVELAAGIKELSGGAVDSSAIIKAFTKGLGDPEAEANLGRLKAAFPALATALKGATTPAEMLTKATEFLGPSLAALKEKAAGPEGSMKRFNAAIGGLQSSIGELLVRAVAPFLTKFGDIATVISKDVVPVVVKVAPYLGYAGAAMAAFVLAAKAEAIAGFAKTLITNLIPGLISSTGAAGGLNAVLSANPIGAVTVGIIALVAATKLLSDALQVTAKERSEENQAQVKLLETQQDQVNSRFEQVASTKSLIDTYRELGSKTNRTAEEQTRFEEATNKLVQTYPGAISGSKSFTENLAALEKASQGTSGELSKLTEQSAQLQEKLGNAKKMQLKLDVEVQEEDLQKQIDDAIGPGTVEKIFSNGTASAKDILSRQIGGTFTQALNAAKNDQDVLNASIDFQTKIFKMQEAGDISAKEAQAITEQVQKVTEAKQKQLAAFNENAKKLTEDQVKEISNIYDRSLQGGLTVDQTIQNITRSFKISNQAAREAALSGELKKAAGEGKLTQASVDDLAKKFGVSKEKAAELLIEQKKQTEEAGKTKDAVEQIADAFDQTLKTAQETTQKGISKISGLFLEIAKERNRLAQATTDAERKEIQQRISDLETKQQAEIKSTRDEVQFTNNLRTIKEKSEEIVGAKKRETTKATKEARKEGESEFALAKQKFELDKQQLDVQDKLRTAEREAARLKAGRAKSALDDLLTERDHLATIIKEAQIFAERFKIKGIDTTTAADQILGDPAKFDEFKRNLDSLAATIQSKGVAVPEGFKKFATGFNDAMKQAANDPNFDKVRSKLESLALNLNDKGDLLRFRGEFVKAIGDMSNPNLFRGVISQMDTLFKQVEKSKDGSKQLEGFQKALSALLDNAERKAKSLGNISFGVKFKNVNERKEAESVANAQRTAIADAFNKNLELQLKIKIDHDKIEEELRKAERERLEFQVDIGVKPRSVIIDLARGDLEKAGEELISAQRELDQLSFEKLSIGFVDSSEYKLALNDAEQRYAKALSGMTAAQKSFNDTFRKDQEEQIKLLDEAAKKEEETLRKRSEAQQRFVDQFGAVVDRFGKLQIDMVKTNQSRLLEEQYQAGIQGKTKYERDQLEIERDRYDAGLISAEQYRQRKSEIENLGGAISKEQYESQKKRIEEEAARQSLALADRVAGQKKFIEDLAAGAQLQAQRAALQEQMKLSDTALLDLRKRADEARAAGKLAEAEALDQLANEQAKKSNAIGQQLDDIAAQIDEKGDLLKFAAGKLGDSLTDIFANLTQGDTEGIKNNFRNILNTILGGLEAMVSALVANALVNELLKGVTLTGIFALIGAPALEKVIRGITNGVFGGLFSQIRSFPTGGVFTKPTLAMIGDASRLGGPDTEYLFRDHQLRKLLDEVMHGGGSNRELIAAIEALGLRIEGMVGRFELDGFKMKAVVDRVTAAQDRRVIDE